MKLLIRGIVALIMFVPILCFVGVLAVVWLLMGVLSLVEWIFGVDTWDEWKEQGDAIIDFVAPFLFFWR
jgi:hypothetical protein